MKFYIVTFDRNPNASYKELHDLFVAHKGIKKWWHYIQSSYLIGSDELNAKGISEHFSTSARSLGLELTHLVLEVDLSNRQGMLKKGAWEWISKNSPK